MVRPLPEFPVLPTAADRRCRLGKRSRSDSLSCVSELVKTEPVAVNCLRFRSSKVMRREKVRCGGLL